MRRWVKLMLAAVGVVLIGIAAAYYYFFEMGGLEKLVSARLNALIRGRYPVTISVGHLRGDVLEDLSLRDIVVRFDDSLGGGEILSARSLSLEYSLKNLIDRRMIFASVRLDSGVIVLREDSLGKVRLPSATRDTSAGDSDSTAFPEFAIDHLLIQDMQIVLIRRVDTISFYDMDVEASIQSREQTVSVDLVRAGFNSSYPAYRLPDLSGTFTYAQGMLAFRDVTAVRDSTHLKLSGSLNPAQSAGQATVNADNLDLRHVAELTGVKLTGMLDLYGNLVFDSSAVSGTVGVGGRFLIADLNNLFFDFDYSFEDRKLTFDTLHGLILDRCAVAGAGMIDFSSRPETYRLDLALAHFDLQSLVAGSLPSDLNADIHLSGSSFKNDDMLIRVHGEIFDSYFADYPIHRAAGTIDITTRAVTFPDTFTVYYFDNRFDVTGQVEYRDSLLLHVRASLPDLEVYQGKLFVKELGGRATAEAAVFGLTRDPNVQGFLQSDSIWLYDLYADSLEADFNIEHLLDKQQGSVAATAISGVVFDLPYDTIFTFCDLHGSFVEVDTAYLASPEVHASARGFVHHQQQPQQVYVDTLTLQFRDQVLHNRGQIQLSLDPLGIEFHRGAIAGSGAMAMVLGRYSYSGDLNLSLSVNDVPIRAWAGLVRKDFPLDGRASFSGSLEGSLRLPIITINGEVDSIQWKDLVLGNMDIIASYRDRTLFLDSLVLNSEPGVYRARGNFNLEIDLTADSIQVLDRPFDLSISATDNRFDLLQAMLPLIDTVGGDMYADVRLYGTPKDPHLEGAILLTDARVKYYDLVDTLYADSATFLMRDNQIVIEGIQAYIKDRRAPGGRSLAVIDGNLTFRELDRIIWDIDVNLPRAFAVRYELEDIQGVVEGDLSIEGETPPEVSGDLTVLSARYRANFAEPDEGSPIMAVLAGDQSWDLNVNVDVPSNFWIENDDIDAEFAGFLNVIRENGEYRFIGELEILRGQAPLFDRTWSIQPGSRAVYDNIAVPNPTLDVTACTIIRGIATEDEPRRDEELCVVVTGTLEQPQLAVSGDAGYSREDLLPLLVTNTGAANAVDAPFTGLEQRLTGLLSTQVSHLGSRQFSRLGVETFEIDPLYSGKFDPLKSRVTLGFYTLPSLYVYGRTSLAGATGRELGFEYRLNKSILVEGRRDEEDLYHVNLKLHWEFR